MSLIKLKEESKPSWIRYILLRIENNKNFLGFIAGSTGSGKSWSSLSIGEALDPEFSIDRVVFSGIELMTLINDGNLKAGSVIVFEEGGIEMSSKNWQSITNKMLNYLMQTFRHRGFILIMNSPFMDFVDKSTRKLFHAEITTIGIDTKNNTCKLMPRTIQYNGRQQKFYYKKLRVLKNKQIIPVNSWSVNKPSAKLIKAYELKKRAFTDGLNEKILNELIAFQEKKAAKDINKNALTEVQSDVVKALEDGLNVHQIATAFNRDPGTIKHCMRLIKKKGYKFVPKYVGLSVESYTVKHPPK